MEIIQQVVAPVDLVDLIRSHYKTITAIETVILAGGDPTNLLGGKIAVFVPDTKSVVIDMKACLEDQRWMANGMTYVANVWCNLIYTVFHEGAHAKQLMNGMISNDLATWEAQLEILDHDADVAALEHMLNWFSTTKNVPSLRNLGWVGEQVKTLFNNLYSKAHKLINQEMEVWGAGMLVEVAAQNPNLKGDIEILNLPQAYKNTPEAVRLIEAIDAGNVGMVINGKRCLRVGEALELSANKHRS